MNNVDFEQNVDNSERDLSIELWLDSLQKEEV